MVLWRGNGGMFNNPMPSQICTCEKCGKGFLRGFANMDKTGPRGSLCENCFKEQSNKPLDPTLKSQRRSA